MTPKDIPALVPGGAAGGGIPPSAQAQQLTREIEAHIDAATSMLSEFASDLHADAANASATVDKKLDGSVGSLFKSAVKNGAAGAKGVTKFVEDLEDQARAHIDDVRKMIREGGGNPHVLLEPIVAANQLGLHDDHAIETIVAPFVEQRVREESQPGLQTSQPFGPVGGPVAIPDGERMPQGAPPGPGQTPPFWNPPPPAPAPPSSPLPGWIPNPSTPFWVPTLPGGTMENVPVPAPTSPGTPPTSPGPECPTVPPPEPNCPTPIINVYCTPEPAPPTTPPTSPPYPPKPPTTPPTTKPGYPIPGQDGVPPNENIPEEPTVPPPFTSPPTTVPTQWGGSERSWDTLDVCDVATQYLLWVDSNPVPHLGEPTAGPWQYLSGMSNLISLISPKVSTSMGSYVQYAIDYGQMITKAALIAGQNTTGINAESGMAQLGGLSASGIASLLTQAPVERMTLNLEYAWKYQTAFELPSQAEFDNAYMRGFINDAQWECWTRALGHAPHTHRMARDAASATLNLNDLVDLYYRRYISRVELDTESRRIGVINPNVVTGAIALFQEIPPPGDIVRFMLRDVEDPDAVAEGGLDTDFDKKYVGRLKAWGEANGMSYEQMLYNWRAHWSYPSNTQLYQMYWRLRPGRDPSGLVMTKDELVNVLKINDEAPNFINRLIATAYLPINRTDINAAYVAGAFDLKEVIERYMDLGYSPDDAKALGKYIKIKKDQQIQQSTGVWTKRKITANYMTGALKRAEAYDMLYETIPDKDTVDSILSNADVLRAAQARQKCINGIKRRYFTGAIDTIQCRNAMLELNVDRLTADTLREGWTCERENKSKEPTVKMLSEWLEDGIIDQPEFARRLVNLGYEYDDVVRIVQALSLALQAKALANVKKAQADAERKARQARADARQAKKDKADAEKEAQDKKAKPK